MPDTGYMDPIGVGVAVGERLDFGVYFGQDMRAAAEATAFAVDTKGRGRCCQTGDGGKEKLTDLHFGNAVDVSCLSL